MTTNNEDKLKQNESGGLTIDATNAENHCTILAIAPSPHDQDVIWVSTDDGQLHITQDGGENWQSIGSRLPGVPKEAWIPQIELSKINKGEAFVVVNNYRKNDWSAYLYHTTNFGQSFTRIVNDNKVKDFVCSIVQDPIEENLLFLGTDGGLYFSIDKGGNWIKWGEDLPNVQVRDMKIQEDFHDLVLGTFGRSFWVLDDIRPLRQLAKDGKGMLKNELVLFDPPTGYKVNTRSYQGIRFYAQGTFVGDNKARGAQIRYWLKPEKKDESKPAEVKPAKKRKKEADNPPIEMEEPKEEGKKGTHFYVMDMKGDTVRHLEPELKEGLNSFRWNLDAKGVKSPARSDWYNGKEPGNGPLAPGRYKLVLEKDEWRDTSFIDVKFDPRIDRDEAKVKDGIANVTDFNEWIEKCTEAWDQLSKAKKKLGTAEKILNAQEDSIAKEMVTEVKDLHTELDSLMELFMMPEGVKGIQRNPNNLTGKMWGARGYFRGNGGLYSKNGEIAINSFKAKARETIDACNAFFEGPWQQFDAKFNELTLDILGEYEPVKIE